MNTDLILTERWLWLIVSFALALLHSVIQLGWDMLNRQSSPRPPALLKSKNVLYHPIRLLYAVGIPALALFWRGIFTESRLGLKPFPGTPPHTTTLTPITWEQWAEDIGWAVTLGLLAWVVLSSIHRQSAPTMTSPVTHSSGEALRNAVFHQIHGAFYREPFVLLWGLEWGVWLGLLPITLEALTNPQCWNDWQSPAPSRNLLIRIGLILMGTMIYIQTQNLWLMVLADACVGWALGQAEHTT